MLLNVELQRIRGSRARVKTRWTVVKTGPMFQGGLEPASQMAPTIPGVTVFVPADVLVSPVYMVVNYIQGRRTRVSSDW